MQHEALGAANIQPFFMVVVFSLFFGTLANVSSENIPYPLFSYAAVLPWTLFASGITRSSILRISPLPVGDMIFSFKYCPNNSREKSPNPKSLVIAIVFTAASLVNLYINPLLIAG